MNKGTLEGSRSLWQQRILRFFGVVNVGLGLFGLYLMLETLWLMKGAYGMPQYATPRFKPLLWGLSVLQITFNSVLVTAGVKLVRLRRDGMILSLRLFVVEIAYYLGTTFGLIFLLPHRNPLLKSIDTAKTLTDIPLMPQVLTLYPVIGLVAMLWLLRRSAKGSTP